MSSVADGVTQRQRVLQILAQVLDIPPPERSGFLKRICGGDVQVLNLVEEMLELEDEADRFLSRPALPREGPEIGLEAGRIGHYRLVDLLGRGGMGSVYRAVREDDFEIEVAIKLVQAGLTTDATVRRFESERQILARLEHPNISRLLDGGTTADGRPYLVMEYVDGMPIDAYCDAHQLSTRRRLELFRQVCSAVAFAHQSLVVHRDLKPGNILITADGVPKLLDFGIAKLLDPGETSVTMAEERLMTPRYASPEQVLGEPITAASDIYTLGLLLFKLLVGRLPSRLESCPFAEVPSRICSDEPQRPSTAVARAEEIQTPEGRVRRSPDEIGHARDGDLGKLRRRLSGDVDAIVLKALRKEPHHRYASVEQLSQDIDRHLAGLPVLARQGTLLYRGGKFVRRHRWGLAAALTAVLLTAGFVLREHQRLVDEHQRAESLAKVLWNLITVADPDEGELTTRRMLDRAHDQLPHLDGEPELRVEILDALGNMHRRIGNYAEARNLVAESLDYWRQLQPDDDLVLALRINNLGALEVEQGNYLAAEELFREALRMCIRLGQEDSREGLVSLNNLATVSLYSGAYPEAERFYRRILEIRERQSGRQSLETAQALLGLGALHYTIGQFSDAEPLLREALDIRRAILGAEHTKVATVLDLLGSVRFGLGEFLEAERLLVRGLEIRGRLLGGDHTHVAQSERNLGLLLLAEGELETARILLTRAYATWQESPPPGHWRIADIESVLGALLTAEGRFDEAEPCLREGHQRLRAVRGEMALHTREASRRIEEFQNAGGRPIAAAL